MLSLPIWHRSPKFPRTKKETLKTSLSNAVPKMTSQLSLLKQFCEIPKKTPKCPSTTSNISVQSVYRLNCKVKWFWLCRWHFHCAWRLLLEKRKKKWWMRKKKPGKCTKKNGSKNELQSLLYTEMFTSGYSGSLSLQRNVCLFQKRAVFFFLFFRKSLKYFF